MFGTFSVIKEVLFKEGILYKKIIKTNKNICYEHSTINHRKRS